MLERLGQVFRGNEPVAIAIELAVIWAAVFLMLRFLRGTRGAGVLKGVIVILATLILGLRFAETGSDTFARLRFVGEALVGTLALALVVIFQPELRRARPPPARAPNSLEARVMLGSPKSIRAARRRTRVACRSRRRSRGTARMGRRTGAA